MYTRKCLLLQELRLGQNANRKKDGLKTHPTKLLLPLGPGPKRVHVTFVGMTQSIFDEQCNSRPMFSVVPTGEERWAVPTLRELEERWQWAA